MANDAENRLEMLFSTSATVTPSIKIKDEQHSVHNYLPIDCKSCNIDTACPDSMRFIRQIIS